MKFNNIIMIFSTLILSLLLGTLQVHACTTIQPVFELPLNATNTVYASTITTTSSIDCGGCSLAVSTFRAVLPGPTVCIALYLLNLPSHVLLEPTTNDYGHRLLNKFHKLHLPATSDNTYQQLYQFTKCAYAHDNILTTRQLNGTNTH